MKQRFRENHKLELNRAKRPQNVEEKKKFSLKAINYQIECERESEREREREREK